MTVAAFYDTGIYGQSYYDNQNPAELIDISEQSYGIALTEQSYGIALTETEKIEET